MKELQRQNDLYEIDRKLKSQSKISSSKKQKIENVSSRLYNDKFEKDKRNNELREKYK